MHFSETFELRFAMDPNLSLQFSRPCKSIRMQFLSPRVSTTGSCVANASIRTGEGLGFFCGRDHARQQAGGATSQLSEMVCVQKRITKVSKARTAFKKFDGWGDISSTLRRTGDDFFCGGATSRSSSSQEAASALPSDDELKERLGALQEEALHVRDKCNNARSRFMRLTEAAQQLRRRAGLDLDAGHETSARNLLVEKQKVLRAAELSKRRAQLLEEFSTKLSEAISKVEAQLVYVLSSSHSPKEETIIRTVPPRDESVVSIDLNVFDTGEVAANTANSILEEADAVMEEPLEQFQGEKREAMEPSSSTEDVHVENGNRSKEDQNYPTFRDLYSRELELEATIMDVFSDGAGRQHVIELEENSSSLKQMDKESVPEFAGLNRPENHTGHANMDETPFERYLEGINRNVVAVESSLVEFRTGLEGGKESTSTEKVETIDNILKQVRSLKNRTSELIKSHSDGGIQNPLSVQRNTSVPE